MEEPAPVNEPVHTAAADGSEGAKASNERGQPAAVAPGWRQCARAHVVHSCTAGGGRNGPYHAETRAGLGRENRTVVGVLFGAALVMYGFYRGSVRLMKFFFNVSDKQIFEIGFLVGLITAVGIIGAGVATHRHLSLHIDDVRA